MQTDGNLVEYPASGVAVWSTRTRGTGASRVVAPADLVVYSAGTAVTCGTPVSHFDIDFQTLDPWNNAEAGGTSQPGTTAGPRPPATI